MRNRENYNFLISFSPQDVNYFRRIVTECVIATDLAKSIPWLSTAKIIFKSINNNSDINSKSSVDEKKELEEKILRMQIAIKCADVGHPSKPLDLHLEWSRRICEEFYCQGDKEKERGMKISPLCDRDVPASSYPVGQVYIYI